MKNTKDNKGFTLVELIIVIAIMGIIVGLVSLAVIPYLEKSRKSVCVNERDTLARDFTLKYAEELALGEEPSEDLIDEVMTSFGLTKTGVYQYSGLCRSDGIYTVTFNESTKMISEINCSKHGNAYDDLVVSSDPADYLKVLKEVFSEYMSDPTNASKVGSSYRWDSNGSYYTPEIITKMQEKLKALGYKVSDTAMWKIQYDKTKGFMIYWMDTGKKIDSEGYFEKAGKKVTVDNSGNAIFSEFSAYVKTHTVQRGDNTESYLAIDNAQW